MQINLTQIILAVITLIGTIMTGYIIPLLKRKLENEDAQLLESKTSMLWAIVRTGVFAAEQIYSSDEGEKKKSYVLGLLEQQGYKVDVAAVDAAIEAAVKELKMELTK